MKLFIKQFCIYIYVVLLPVPRYRALQRVGRMLYVTGRYLGRWVVGRCIDK
jgi:hypothetical protein